jgi:hypothetical protein
MKVSSFEVVAYNQLVINLVTSVVVLYIVRPDHHIVMDGRSSIILDNVKSTFYLMPTQLREDFKHPQILVFEQEEGRQALFGNKQLPSLF